MKFTDIIRTINKLSQILRLEIRLCQNGQYQRAANLITKKELLFEQYSSVVNYLAQNQDHIEFNEQEIELIEQKQKELDNLARQSKIVLEIVIRAHEEAIEKQVRIVNNDKTTNYNQNAQLKENKSNNIALDKQA